MTLLDEAIVFAVQAHSGMMRKRESLPFILHPLEVATIVGTLTSDEQVLAAAVLHDTVEDTQTTMDDIREKFGERVAALVASETEDKHRDKPASETWMLRKVESLRELKNCSDPAVKVLWLGDKLSNMRSFYRGWKIRGNRMWQDFNQSDPALQAWYYRSIVKLLGEYRYCDAWQELNSLVETIFEGVSSHE